MSDSKSHLSDQLLRKTLFLVRLDLVDQNNVSYFSFLAVTPSELEALTEARKTEWFDPNRFGTLIVAGEGEPTQEVLRILETEYGFHHAQALRL